MRSVRVSNFNGGFTGLAEIWQATKSNCAASLLERSQYRGVGSLWLRCGRRRSSLHRSMVCSEQTCSVTLMSISTCRGTLWASIRSKPVQQRRRTGLAPITRWAQASLRPVGSFFRFTWMGTSSLLRSIRARNSPFSPRPRPAPSASPRRCCHGTIPRPCRALLATRYPLAFIGSRSWNSGALFFAIPRSS